MTTWPRARFDQILTRVDRRIELDDAAEYETVGVRWYGLGAFVREKLFGHQIGRKQQWIIRSGDIVYNKLFAWKGSFALADDSVDGRIVSDKFPTYRADTEKVDPRYLAYYFRTDELAKQALDMSKGGAAISKLTLNPPQFWDLAIPLPPLAEQQRIVAKIERLAAKVEEARGLRLASTSLADSTLERCLRIEREKLLASNWPVAPIGSIAKVSSGGTPSRDNDSYWNGTIAWIKTGELVDGDIERAEEYITEVALINSGAKLFPPDTILIALYGQGQTRGRTGRLLIPAATNQACSAILPTPELLCPRFTQYWLRSYYSELRQQSHGGAQPNWNSGTIKRIPIALPPLDEQKKLVEYLNGLQTKVVKLKAVQLQTAAELDALLPAVLDRAFRGEL